MKVEVLSLVRDEGTVVLFEGVDVEHETRVCFAADHRPARDIVAAREAHEPVVVDVEPWQIWPMPHKRKRWHDPAQRNW